MMDDNKSKNFNSIIISLVCELLFENNNKAINRNQCLNYITNDLNINIETDLFYSLLDKNQHFEHTPEGNDVVIKLTSDKYNEINRKVSDHSIENYIENFVKEKSYSNTVANAIKSLLYNSIYENINSFTVTDIKSIIPEDLRKKYTKDEIDAFNSFLDENNKAKNAALFYVFLKAVEFAIVTSGKGVKSFTKNIFTGKEYFLDSNIIFRILGVGGNERKESLIRLIKSCVHQGIKFKYTSETYKEVGRKLEASLTMLKNATENKSIEIIKDLLDENGIEFNNSFITHYAECMINDKIKTPEFYQIKMLADLRSISDELGIDSFAATANTNQLEYLKEDLYEKKIEKNIRYTKQAAYVDAINILTVRKIRGANNYNYSDIKSFYLTTDRTLNSILVNEDKNNIAETILPSQLYILHNALSMDDDEKKDYQAFNVFLKRRTTEFKYEGEDVLRFIDDIRNFTSDKNTIKHVIKCYSDGRYSNSLNSLNSKSEYRSIKEYAETYFDIALNNAQVGDEKYQATLSNAIINLSTYLKESKRIIRVGDIMFSILLIPISVLILKEITKDTTYIVLGTLFAESIKFLISTKTNLYSSLCKSIFKIKFSKSHFNIATEGQESSYIKAANQMISKEINVWR